MEKAIKVVNQLKEDGIIKDYAIGGGIATIHYVEPLLTYDLDIFFLPQKEGKGLISLSPIYEFLRKKGYKPHKEQVIIGKIPVQFLPPYNELIREAIENAVDIKYKKEKTRIFKAEYLLAIMIQTGRPKDKERIIKLLDESKVNKNYLMKILQKYNLREKFKRFQRLYYEEKK